jgi:alkylation response protein AidB-like acyl-CoA dehydrogenase
MLLSFVRVTVSARDGVKVDLSISGEQRQLVDSFAAIYARESTSERVRAAEPLGFDAQLWSALMDTGVTAMAVDVTSGGWGASVLELALIAEQYGRSVASAPVIEAQVAVRVLAECGAAGADLLGEALSGEKLVSFAPRAGDRSALALVPAGAVADTVVALVGERLVAVPLTENRRPVQNLGSLPLADVLVGDDAVVLAESDDARRLSSAALDLWLTLTAVALAGAAKKAVELGVEYAKQRHAFGTAIGTFQAVSHPLADSATAADGARFLGLKAACAFIDEPGRVTELAAMAFAFAYETARDATHRSLHIHGGYGFGMEGDIQLYYRRARGWGMVYGEPAVALDRVADARYGAVAG